MRGRKKSKDLKERAHDITEQAREVAGEGGEALKDFASQTGAAAKEFADKTRDAAKDLVEHIEKAAKHAAGEEEPRKSRRLLKLILAVGIGVAVFTNERTRSLISRLTGRDTRAFEPPEVWRPESSPNGGNAQKAATTTGDTTV